MIVIRPLAASDHPAAVDLLVSAFAQDRGMQALLGSDTTGLADWFSATLQLLAAPAGGCLAAYDGKRLCGVLLHAGPAGPGAWRQIVWASRVATRCGPGRVLQTIDHDRARRGHGAGGGRVVEFVAVDQALRGQGVARRLFEALHREGTDTWLETTRPENLPIFGRLGYRETSRRVEHGVTYFSMERTPP